VVRVRSSSCEEAEHLIENFVKIAQAEKSMQSGISAFFLIDYLGCLRTYIVTCLYQLVCARLHVVESVISAS
jgi:hypothetical protein